MNIIGKKPVDNSKNVFYGIDVNDKQAVEKEYKRLQRQHRRITILVIIVLAILGVIGFDFYRVNYVGGKPLFAVSKKVERGTLFSGLGYKVLYCENGERYVGSVLYKTCEEVDEITFTHVVYEKLIDYASDNKIVDIKNLKKMEIVNLAYDEDNDQEGKDYLLDISFECNDGSSKCFRTGKEFYDPFNVKVYVSLNRYNEIYQMLTFKDKGEYYNSLVETYTEKVETYFKENQLLDEENVKLFKLGFASNNGMYKFRGTTYADTYLISIDYACNDNSNDCVKYFDKKDIDGDYANLSFYASLFLDAEGEVALIGPREYLDIE